MFCSNICTHYMELGMHAHSSMQAHPSPRNVTRRILFVCLFGFDLKFHRTFCSGFKNYKIYSEFALGKIWCQFMEKNSKDVSLIGAYLASPQIPYIFLHLWVHFWRKQSDSLGYAEIPQEIILACLRILWLFRWRKNPQFYLKCCFRWKSIANSWYTVIPELKTVFGIWMEASFEIYYKSHGNCEARTCMLSFYKNMPA